MIIKTKYIKIVSLIFFFVIFETKMLSSEGLDIIDTKKLSFIQKKRIYKKCMKLKKTDKKKYMRIFLKGKSYIVTLEDCNNFISKLSRKLTDRRIIKNTNIIKSETGIKIGH